MTALLEARGLAVGHGSRVVAADIALALRPGRILCLLGPNGGGKTTLLGLISPLAGEVRLGGGEYIASLPRREVATRLAYVPQAAPGGFAYPARKVVAMGRAARLPIFAAPDQRDRAAAEAELAPARHRPSGRPAGDGVVWRRAPTGADRPRPGAGRRLPGAGRTGGEPRFRQPSAGLARSAGAGRARPACGADDDASARPRLPAGR